MKSNKKTGSQKKKGDKKGAKGRKKNGKKGKGKNGKNKKGKGKKGKNVDQGKGGVKPVKAPSNFWGMNSGTVISSYDVDVDGHMEMTKKSGIKYVRFNFLDLSEKDGNGVTYNFEHIDNWVAIAARHHLKVLPVLIGAPDWSLKKAGNSLPKDPKTFAAFCTACVKRFGHGGDFWSSHDVPSIPIDLWEVWNEPNFKADYTRGASVKDFAKMAYAAAKAIKKADKRGKTIFGGLISHNAPLSPESYLTKAVKAVPGLKKAFHGMGFHPYAADGNTAFGKVKKFRKTMDKVGLKQMPLYLTEFGWQGKKAIPDAKMGQNMKTFVKLAASQRKKLKIAQIYPFLWWSPPGSAMAVWGIVANADLSLTKNGEAYLGSIKK